MKGIDLFAGCGGMSLGFLNAGFDIMLAVDVWQAAGEIYRRNIQNVDFLLQDIRKLDIGTLKKYNPDIIIGGPPCQDFSSAGNRNGNGAHADMTYVFSEVVCKLSPDWFVMENVQEVAKSLVFSEAKELFKENQYGLTEVKLNASYFGVPQNRIRLFLIGKKNEKEGFLTRFIKEEITKKSSSTPLTIREFFGDRIDTQYYYRHPRSYSRRGIFSIDEPSPTIRGVNRPIPKNYKIHTGDACKDLSMVRPLTTKERSLIQTFPEDFIFEGTKTDTEQIIGNAVPVKLAEFVGTTIKHFIELQDACSFSKDNARETDPYRQTLYDWLAQ